ncbi:ABC transporter permease [Virgisporangium aurantiacum]|uniref:ABC transporter permease n=1 Tax=Virgisporangium aurantiacum TaxID=175570 RepID=A0A8J4DZ05_9ACTN|nr:ABC transporter permease [Virgisporangium aurantiacum]GIJ53577.1 ABC transporter permease [Virgisporangium aurantiacum]
MKGRFDPVRILPPIVAPIVALLISVLVSALVLTLGGHEVISTFQAMWEYGTRPGTINGILNKTVYYYLGAVAAAIGFRMGLFNIGIEGQYRLAVLLAGALGGASFTQGLPGPVRIVLMILAAMVVGAAWASIAGLLKVTRGVSEVISTIMLNFIAGGLFAWLLTTDLLGVRAPGSNSVTTPILEKDAWIPGILLIPGTNARFFGFGIIAALVGVGYWFMIERTRFGYDLRATGHSPSAAVASGVDAKRMVVVTMMLSGAVAGLIGLPELLGQTHAVAENVGGYGFTGIAIALLGRNHPIGMILGAMLWGALENSAQILDLNDIPRETVTIMQGTVVLAVVVAYELAARIGRRIQQKQVGESTGTAAVPPTPPTSPAKEEVA